MRRPIEFPDELASNTHRAAVAKLEPLALRTYTPTQAVLARSAGIYHWTPEGRRLFDFTSGVLVSNLGHNPRRWMERFAEYMGWTPELLTAAPGGETSPWFEAAPLTAYNAVTPLETLACQRLVDSVQSSPGGARLDTVMWAASGSEAVQKALWACLHRDKQRPLILATRYGFHGKKGLAGAVTGSEADADRDPRVVFISFPMAEVDDHARVSESIDLEPYEREWNALWEKHGKAINCLITEPYLGGGGSYHPPAAYLQRLERFCRAHDVLFILDEVQANFGRTGRMYAFERYGLAPDFVVLGKGLGNGVPVAAVVGRGDVMESLKYGEASDTWSANPLSCAAVLATLDCFPAALLEQTRALTPLFFAGLDRLKETGLIAKVRGESEGLVFGLECAPYGGLTDKQVAAEIVQACYLGEAGGDGIHLLGALAGNVIRVSPPLVIEPAQARAALELMQRVVTRLAQRLGRAVPPPEPERTRSFAGQPA